MAQFDPNPSIDDIHTEGDVKWIYDGVKWVKQVPTIKTENILLSDPTHPASLAASSVTLPDVPADTATQLEANRYYMNALRQLDDTVQGIHVGENPPTEFSNGTLWYDSTSDVDKLKVYYDPTETKNGNWVDATPVDLTDLTDKIDGLETDLTADLAALTGRVGDNESDIIDLQALTATHTGQISDIDDSVQDILTTENTQQGQIDTLENKVAALEGAVIDALYRLSARDVPNEGEFQIFDAGPNVSANWAPVTKIVFHPTDNNTITHTFDIVGLEDYLRIGGAVGGAVYKVKSPRSTNADGNYEFGVEIVSSDDAPFPSLVYDFEFAPGFDASAYATKTYVDDAAALKVNKAGDTITGILNISTAGQANDDGARLYMKDTTGTTNLTLFPSGLISAKNQIRVRRDTGDSFVVQTDSGTTKAKWNSDGHIEAPRVRLTGGGTANANERVIDIQSGISGRLAYNGETRLSWGSSTVWIGKSGALGDDVASQSVALNLQKNAITNIGTFLLDHANTSTTGSKFVIKGETADGAGNELFYSYRNGVGEQDAINYKGRMTNAFNIVNKGYVDTAIAGVDTSGAYLPLAGGTLTGKLTISAGDTNGMVDFTKTGNNDIRYQGDWIVSFQGNSSPLVKLNTALDMNSKKINNVADPSSDTDAVNRRSLKGATIAQTSSGSTSGGGFYQSNGRLFYKLI